nr:hypothetical protein Iba_chr14aCG12240 [Ipomoea batatas]GME06353.1 hypothetical protein Iba_scaffold3997CG0540 [Ipomoea batatas]
MASSRDPVSQNSDSIISLSFGSFSSAKITGAVRLPFARVRRSSATGPNIFASNTGLLGFSFKSNTGGEAVLYCKEKVFTINQTAGSLGAKHPAVADITAATQQFPSLEASANIPKHTIGHLSHRLQLNGGI